MVTSTPKHNIDCDMSVATPWGTMILKYLNDIDYYQKLDLSPCNDEDYETCPCQDCILANLSDDYEQQGYSVVEFVNDFTINMNTFNFLPTSYNDTIGMNTFNFVPISNIDTIVY